MWPLTSLQGFVVRVFHSTAAEDHGFGGILDVVPGAAFLKNLMNLPEGLETLSFRRSFPYLCPLLPVFSKSSC
jgi:hypothetical protein